jgi:catechol 2,3-dioxygenase-like lactoylglutathione lyase family enzyme
MQPLLTLRVARPTDNLVPLITFYCDGLGLEILYQFDDHAGFSGVMLGYAAWPYHFEFTHQHGHNVGRAPSQDNLLVFYLPDHTAWRAAVDRMQAHGFDPV